MAKLHTLNQPASLPKIAYEALRESILAGTLRRGQVYNEIALAKDMGISRTPVREALLELAAQGLVTFLPRKGVKINHYSPGDIEEIFEVRKAIELAAVEKVAQASPPLDLGKAAAALENQKKAAEKKDFETLLKADREFHTALSELTNNRRFVIILENISDMIQLMGTLALTIEGRYREVLGEHEKVLEAVRDRRPQTARKAMDYHLERSKTAALEARG
ncbi:MAG: GntR family transcriptional regulator [Thermodesulfobacteriota bacterium]